MNIVKLLAIFWPSRLGANFESFTLPMKCVRGLYPMPNTLIIN